ncbi:hypothetical protein BGZ99_005540 [Dissophora globulifera]|uniref:RRM domain-containing protein n=1 Tax=Dissophora globulifera TaxID=979702 RepID=A0A9P6RSJ9_9FUNG|nr:hypothetical protein BGZ99_005540 [Dissophora globulifera]
MHQKRAASQPSSTCKDRNKDLAVLSTSKSVSTALPHEPASSTPLLQTSPMAAKDNTKSTLYIGGLDDQVTPQVLHAAFVPFGEITHIEIPPDPTSNAPHRGFGFIEFDLPADAQAAQDNMHLSELFGKTIKVNLAKPLKGGSGLGGGMGRGPEKAIWADEEWLKQNVLGEDPIASQEQQDGLSGPTATAGPSTS